MSIGTEINGAPARVEDAPLAAAAAGAAVAVQLFLERLPPNADLILPRMPFFFLYEIGIGIRGSPFLSSLISSCCSALLILSGVLFLRRAWKEHQLAAKGARLLLALALMFIPAAAAGALLRACLDLLQHAWFKPESLDIREPALAFAAAAATVLLLWRAALSILGACLKTRTRAATLAALGRSALLIAAALGVSGHAQSRFAGSSGELSDAAAIPREPREQRGVLVLTQGPKGPDYEVHALTLGAPGLLDYSLESLEVLEGYIRRGAGLHLQEALRHLYGGYTLRMAADPLREALYLAHQKGDALARLLLLENLTRAPRGELVARLLDALSDESAYRVGPRAAAMLAVAYGHLGQSERSAYWRGAGTFQRGGIPAGLLAPMEAPFNGALRGTLSGLGPVHAALYHHGDPAVPYSLGPSSLIDSRATDARGSFEFKGLPAGGYFLVFSFDPRRFSSGSGALGKCYMGSGARPPCISFVANHRGDIRLDPEHPRADLGVIEPHFLK